MSKQSTVRSYIFNQPFNKTARPFLVAEAANGHPVVFGAVDNPVKILTVDGGGDYPVIAMMPSPPGVANKIMRASNMGHVEGSNLQLFLLERTVTQYLNVIRIGQGLQPTAKFYNYRSDADGEDASQYAVVPVEIPVPWDYPERITAEDTDNEESEHEDA